MVDDNNDEDVVAADDRLTFSYIKSNYFRVIHADGVYGGLTPRGTINMAFFSERAAIPRVTERVRRDDEPSKLAPEEAVQARPGLVRELEANVTVDINAAMEIYQWLGERIELMRERFDIPDEDWERLKGKNNAK